MSTRSFVNRCCNIKIGIATLERNLEVSSDIVITMVPCPIPVVKKRGRGSPLKEHVYLVVTAKQTFLYISLLNILSHISLGFVHIFKFYFPPMFQIGQFLLPCCLASFSSSVSNFILILSHAFFVQILYFSFVKFPFISYI